jgi:membrane-associated PAP2 superfamily phosphatase
MAARRAEGVIAMSASSGPPSRPQASAGPAAAAQGRPGGAASGASGVTSSITSSITSSVTSLGGDSAPRGGPRGLLVAFALAGVAFVLWPQVDLAVSGWFADGSAGFPLQHDPQFGAVNKAVLQLSRIANWMLLALALLAWIGWARNPLARWRRPLVFLALAAALGPGLLVNVLLKEHSGRARPVQSVPFGGDRQFTPAFLPADQCDDNCSFVSGHTAGATMPAAGYFLAATRRRRRLWLAGGLALGAAAGLLRIVVGAHYLSDVVMAIGFTWAVIALCALLLPRPGARTAAHAGQ